MAKFTAKQTPLPAERRANRDRRHVDGAPPGKHDRRRGLEPRLPEVVELDMSSSEWMTLSDEPELPPKRLPRP